MSKVACLIFLLLISCNNKTNSSINSICKNFSYDIGYQYISISRNDTISLNFYENYVTLYFGKDEINFDCEVSSVNEYNYNVLDDKKKYTGHILRKEDTNGKNIEFEIWLDCQDNKFLRKICGRILTFTEK